MNDPSSPRRSTEFFREEVASLGSDPSGFSSTDEVLARLDAASETRAGRRPERSSITRYWPLLAGALAAVVIAWAGMVWFGGSPGTFSPPVLEAVPAEDRLPFVLVKFAEGATMADVTGVLQRLGLEITAGPLPGGSYRITVPAETGAAYDTIVATLETEPVIGWIVIGRRPEGR